MTHTHHFIYTAPDGSDEPPDQWWRELIERIRRCITSTPRAQIHDSPGKEWPSHVEALAALDRLEAELLGKPCQGVDHAAGEDCTLCDGTGRLGGGLQRVERPGPYSWMRHFERVELGEGFDAREFMDAFEKTTTEEIVAHAYWLGRDGHGPRTVEPQPEPSEDAVECGPSDVVAGALYDFLGALTTGETIEMGSSINAVPAMDRLKEWAARRGLDIENADVQGWRERLLRASRAAEDE